MTGLLRWRVRPACPDARGARDFYLVPGLKSLSQNCKIRTSAAFCRTLVVAKAATHKDSQVLTPALQPAKTCPIRSVIG
jgi:hypothetical protein